MEERCPSSCRHTTSRSDLAHSWSRESEAAFAGILTRLGHNPKWMLWQKVMHFVRGAAASINKDSAISDTADADASASLAVPVIAGRPLALTLASVPHEFRQELIRLSFVRRKAKEELADTTHYFIRNMNGCRTASAVTEEGTARWCLHPMAPLEIDQDEDLPARPHGVVFHATRADGRETELRWTRSIAVEHHSAYDPNRQSIGIDWKELQTRPEQPAPQAQPTEGARPPIMVRRVMSLKHKTKCKWTQAQPAIPTKKRKLGNDSRHTINEDENEAIEDDSQLQRAPGTPPPEPTLPLTAREPMMSHHQPISGDDAPSTTPTPSTTRNNNSNTDNSSPMYLSMQLFDARTKQLIPWGIPAQDGTEVVLVVSNPSRVEAFRMDATVVDRDGNTVPVRSKGAVEVRPRGQAVLCRFAVRRECAPLRLCTVAGVVPTGQKYNAQLFINVEGEERRREGQCTNTLVRYD